MCVCQRKRETERERERERRDKREREKRESVCVCEKGRDTQKHQLVANHEKSFNPSPFPTIARNRKTKPSNAQD